MTLHRLAALLCFALGLPLSQLSPLHAQSETGTEPHARQMLIAAYGGDRLAELERIEIISQRGVAWPGQGQSAEFVEFADDRVIKQFDFRSRHGSVERWTLQNGNFYHGREIIGDSGLTVIDYATGHFTTDPEQSFATAFAGDWRGLDLLIAKRVFDDPSVVTGIRSTVYAGHPTAVLTILPEADAQVFEAYVSQRDGLIRRVSFESPFGMAHLLWRDHQVSDGFKHAATTHVVMDGETIEIEQIAALRVNSSIAEFLGMEASLEPRPEMVDTSEMTVEELAPDLFWVGQDDYSLFARHDGGWIAVSPYAGFNERFVALQEHTNSELPLSSIIATHHHRDHLRSIADAVALGATVVTTKEAKTALSQDWYDGKEPEITVAADGMQIGPYQLLIEPTAHSPANIFVLHEASGVLFQEDHYHAFFPDNASRIQPTAVELWRALQRRDVTITALVSGHARKAEPWAIFARAAASADKDDTCPSRREICSENWLSSTGVMGQ